ncbi:MAG: hypothetical protein EBS20_02465 [Actinobacteria bacterium]|nr:hypothetical protein [Actinomycetota bacterium]
MVFCWFTTRRRMVGPGYGMLLRGTYAVIGALGVVAGLRYGSVRVRDVSAAIAVVACTGVLIMSIAQRRAGVSGATAEHDRRSERIAEMTGIRTDVPRTRTSGREFWPHLDLVPVVIAVVGLVAAAAAAVDSSFGDDPAVHLLSLGRILIGAAFLGAITDAMLLGHWYLVQPGLPRRLLNEIVAALGAVWPLEVVVMLVPTGMVSVLTGTVDDGWGGTLGWFWCACAITTGVLVWVTRAALRERQYSAVMAATGLLYLALITAFGTDVVARAVLEGA